MRHQKVNQVLETAFKLSQEIFEITLSLPEHEQHAMADHLKRSTYSLLVYMRKFMFGTPLDHQKNLTITLGLIYHLYSQLKLAKRLRYLDEMTFLKLKAHLNFLKLSFRKYVDTYHMPIAG